MSSLATLSLTKWCSRKLETTHSRNSWINNNLHPSILLSTQTKSSESDSKAYLNRTCIEDSMRSSTCSAAYTDVTPSSNSTPKSSEHAYSTRLPSRGTTKRPSSRSLRSNAEPTRSPRWPRCSKISPSVVRCRASSLSTWRPRTHLGSTSWPRCSPTERGLRWTSRLASCLCRWSRVRIDLTDSLSRRTRTGRSLGFTPTDRLNCKWPTRQKSINWSQTSSRLRSFANSMVKII